MGEHQGTFNLWSDEDPNDLMSDILNERLTDLNNNSGDIEAPVQTDLSAQASWTPVAASAHPLVHPIVSSPSLSTCEASELQYGPAALNHTTFNVSDCLDPDKTASLTQRAQVPTLEENESFDFNDFIRLDSQEPTETASPLQPVQPSRYTEEETFPLVDLDSNSTMVPDTTFDPHGLQEATDDANLIQAPVPVENYFLRSIDLDPRPSTALPEMAPTSSEQPALLFDNTMMVPTAASESASSAIPFDGALFQDALDLASNQDTITSPACGVNRALSVPGEQFQSTSGSSLSHRRDYIEIGPKATETTQSIEMSSARHPQDLSNVIRPSSEVVLATCATPSSVKGKRKRSQSFAETQSGIPKAFTCVFPASNSTVAARRGQQQPPTGKRTRSAKACLRCQMQNVACSGSIPCTNCKALFQRKTRNHSQTMIAWRYCIDSDLLHRNIFLQINTGFRSLTRVSNLDSVRDPIASTVPDPTVLRGIIEVISLFRGNVEGMSIDAGISSLIGLQFYRIDLALRPSRTTLAPPLFWMKRFLSRKALRVNTINPRLKGGVPSLAWIFLGTIFHPETIANLTGLKFADIEDFTVWICHEFHNRTAMLLKKMRTAKMDSVEEDWVTLNENLTAIYLLTMYRSIQWKLQLRLETRTRHECFFEVIQYTQKKYLGRIGDAIQYLTSFQAVEDLMLREGDLISEVAIGHPTPRDAIVGITGIEDRTILRGNQIPFMDQHQVAMNEEAWDHLRDYTQHWLQRMGEGPGCFGRVMINTFNLNTLCRLKGWRRSLAPPDFHRPSIHNVVEEAFTFYQTLDQGSKEQQARMRRFANSIPSAFERFTAQSATQQLLIKLNDVQASERSKRSPSEGKDRKIKAPEDFPQDSLGFLEPLVARGRGIHKPSFYWTHDSRPDDVNVFLYSSR